MKLFSESIHLVKSVQYAFSHCHWIHANQSSIHAVESLSVLVVFMRWVRKHVGEEKSVFAHSAELHHASTSDEETVKRLKKLMDANNAHSFNQMAGLYRRGDMVMPQDYEKANELYLKAGELGCNGAYYNLGTSYADGMGVEVDKKKAKHYWELAAMNGSVVARHNLGRMEGRAGNVHRSMKHFVLAARAGDKDSLGEVKEGYMHGIVTKVEYANTLHAYQKNQDEMKSDDRDKATSMGV